MGKIRDTVVTAQAVTAIRKGWLPGVIRGMKKGQLHRDLGVPENRTIGRAKIEAAARSHPDPQVRKRAKFALELMGFHKAIEQEEVFAKVETFSKPGTADVTPSDRKKIEPLARHYLSMDHPFTHCVADQIKHGLSQDHANRRCAVLLDTFDPERKLHSRPAS